jgi:hypothetical protein
VSMRSSRLLFHGGVETSHDSPRGRMKLR